MIDLSRYGDFSRNMKPLRKISEDTKNNTELISSDLPAVSFDDVKTQYTAALSCSDENAYSVDALMQNGDRVLMIEFKNEEVKSGEIKRKIWDSLLIFCDITKKQVSDTRAETDFFLVYNKNKNELNHQEKKMISESENRDWLNSHVFRIAGQEIIRFDLSRFQGLYFREVHTYTTEQFEDYLTKHFPA